MKLLIVPEGRLWLSVLQVPGGFGIPELEGEKDRSQREDTGDGNLPGGGGGGW